MPSDRHREIERRMLDLIAGAELQAPDEVAYEPESVLFIWHDTKAVVCVDLHDMPELDRRDDSPYHPYFTM